MPLGTDAVEKDATTGASNSGLSCFSVVLRSLYAAYCWVSFSHLTELFEKGAATTLDPSSARYAHPTDCDPTALFKEFSAAYSCRQGRGESSSPRDVAFALIYQERHYIAAYFALLCPEIIVRICGPFTVRRFLIWIEDYKEDRDSFGNGWLWAGLLVLVPFLYMLLHHMAFWIALKSGYRMRLALGAAVHDKMLRLSASSLAKITTGHVVNLAGNDLKRLELVVGFWPYFLLGPFEGLVVLVAVAFTLGVAPAVAGTAVIFSIIPMQIVLSKYIRKLRAKTAVVTDKRMLGWEDPLTDDVKEIRQREHKLLTLNGYIKALNTSLPGMTRALAICAMFVTCSYTKGEFNTPDIFFALSLLMLPQMTVALFFVMASELTSEAYATARRLDAFFKLPDSVSTTYSCESGKRGHLEIRNGQYGWFSQPEEKAKGEKGPPPIVTQTAKRHKAPGAPAEFLPQRSTSIKKDAVSGLKQTLFDINLVVQPGELVGIAGKVGSGKSSLLAALLNEMETLSESQNAWMSGTVSFCSQTPWIVSGTVRENILFSKPFEGELYRKVVSSCALAVDFEQFPSGDASELGERGINISGGQKARVALARAAYSQADIHLLDDPLSAVDPRVGRILFDKCIGSKGVMRGSTRLLVTHQRHCLPYCDRVVLMADGRIEAVGTWEELSEHEALKSSEPQTDREETSLDTDGAMCTEAVATLAPRCTSVDTPNNVETRKETASEESGERQLVKAEGKEEGTVKSNVYWAYIDHIGAIAAAAVLLIILASQSCYFLLEWWVAKWSSIGASDQQDTKWITVLVSLTGAAISVQMLGVFALFALFVLGSTRLHNQMLQSMAHAPLKFFHTNPTGRILNRFSKDLGIQDEEIPFIVCDILLYGGVVCGTLVFVAIALPYMLIFFVLITWVFLRVRNRYAVTSSELKRFDGLTRSPIYAMLSSNIKGLSTIRAYGTGEKFQERFMEALDLNGTWWTAFCQATRWLGFRMDGIATFVALSSAIMAVALADKVDADILGLALTYLSFLSGVMQWTMRQTAELENAMTSVERNMEYARLEQEPPRATQGGGQAPGEWPTVGSLEYKAVSASYRPGLDPVLKNLTFTIPGGSSVGIVGRTGSGKSSLLLTLFRLIDIDNGVVRLDGVNTAQIGIDVLRKQLAVIPQDPVLFGGTLRSNLDRWNQHSDAKIWEVLKSVCLDSVANEVGGLDAVIAESGGNLSVGQRQLLSLARSLLSDAKILALDEATANVDRITDALIQESLRSLISQNEKTLLIIAHRIDTVMDCDLMLVLENGELVEFGTPAELISEDDGFFARMVQAARTTTSMPK